MRNTKLEVRLKSKNVGYIAKNKSEGRKRSDWWHRSRVDSKANMMKKFCKVNVPMPIIVKHAKGMNSLEVLSHVLYTTGSL